MIFTAYDYPQYVQAALAEGAAGFVAKSATYRRADRGRSSGRSRRLAFRRQVGAAGPALTARDVEVIGLVADGLSNDEIGRTLGITSKSVEAHISRIFARTGVRSRTAPPCPAPAPAPLPNAFWLAWTPCIGDRARALDRVLGCDPRRTTDRASRPRSRTYSVAFPRWLSVGRLGQSVGSGPGATSVGRRRSASCLRGTGAAVAWSRRTALSGAALFVEVPAWRVFIRSASRPLSAAHGRLTLAGTRLTLASGARSCRPVHPGRGRGCRRRPRRLGAGGGPAPRGARAGPRPPAARRPTRPMMRARSRRRWLTARSALTRPGR